MSAASAHITNATPSPIYAVSHDTSPIDDLHAAIEFIPRTFKSSQILILALCLFVASTIHTILDPSRSSSLAQDSFKSVVSPAIDGIDMITSPAVILSFVLLLVGTAVRGVENVIHTVGFKGRC